jgi:pyruvate kinase
MRRAKIVCTIGPASSSSEKLRALLVEGMDMARFNFSHGGGEKQAAAVALLREEARLLKRDVALLQDLQGPKIRTGAMQEGGAQLENGASFFITTREFGGDASGVSTTYQGLPHDCKPDDTILLDDGHITLRVLETDEQNVRCKVCHGGLLKSNKGINLPGVAVSASALSDKDKRDVEWAIANDFDYIALSFVRRAQEVRELKQFIAERGASTRVIAKLEKPEAIDNLDEIIEASDGVMVARGDLGVEMAPETVPLLQKRIIRAANAAGKFVITATQMLESMTAAPRPTRAEASDVANAVLDGSDALMLSGETAAGDFPVESLKMMSRIIEEVELGRRDEHTAPAERREYSPVESSKNGDFTRAICEAAARAAKSLNAHLIACCTETGSTAHLLASFRPAVPIIACTPHASVARSLAPVWGVHALLTQRSVTADEMIVLADFVLVRAGLAHAGDVIIVTLGAPVAQRGSTDLMKLHRVGETDFL